MVETIAAELLVVAIVATSRLVFRTLVRDYPTTSS
jgi:hypothetical protein